MAQIGSQGLGMDRRRSRLLKQIIVLSQQMLEKARAMEWDRVADLEVRRKQQVITCFQHPGNVQEAPEVAICIREILQLNDEIYALGSDCKARLCGELHTHKRGRTASTAYLSCASTAR